MGRSASTDVCTKFHALTTYATEEQVKTVLQVKSSQIEHARYIYHHKEDKEPHLHLAIVTIEPRKLSAIRGWFKELTDSKGQYANTLSEELISTSSMEQYFTHTDEKSMKDKTKHQYTSEDIKVLFGDSNTYLSLETRIEEERRVADESAERKAKKRAETAEDIDQQINDIIAGVPLRIMAKKYGRDYIKNRRVYNDYVAMIVCEETGALPMHLLADPVAEKINDLRRQAANDGYEEALKVSNALWNMAANDCGISQDKLNQITKYMEKMLRKD